MAQGWRWGQGWGLGLALGTQCWGCAEAFLGGTESSGCGCEGRGWGVRSRDCGWLFAFPSIYIYTNTDMGIKNLAVNQPELSPELVLHTAVGNSIAVGARSPPHPGYPPGVAVHRMGQQLGVTTLLSKTPSLGTLPSPQA